MAVTSTFPLDSHHPSMGPSVHLSVYPFICGTRPRPRRGLLWFLPAWSWPWCPVLWQKNLEKRKVMRLSPLSVHPSIFSESGPHSTLPSVHLSSVTSTPLASRYSYITHPPRGQPHVSLAREKTPVDPGQPVWSS